MYYLCLIPYCLIPSNNKRLSPFITHLVVPRNAHKGHIVKKILEKSKDVDFVLCMGDDVSDEKMFTVSYGCIILLLLIL